MADIKWLKITNTMFEDEKIEYLESLPDGDALINIWVKTLCLASKCNERGYLVFANEIPYTFDLLAIKFKKTVKQIEYAYSLFSKLGMLSYENDIFTIHNWTKYQSVDRLEEIKEKNRIRVSNFRQKEKEKKLIEECNVTSNVTSNEKCNDFALISISNSISNTLDINNNIKEEEKEIYKEKDLPTTVMLSINDILKTIKNTYAKYEYNTKYHRTATAKRIKTLLLAKEKDKKLYPLQIVFAYAQYLAEKYEEGTEVNYIKGSEVFLSNEVYDYAEKINSAFLAKMVEKYGEDWQSLKFGYKD